MELFKNLDAAAEACREGAGMTIGMFDGVHRGHQMLIGRALEQARRLGLASLVLTFSDHPLSLLAPPFAPQLLSSARQKTALIEAQGVDLCLMLDFTPSFAAIEAEQFLQEILLDRCRMRYLVCGEDFRFGARGGGDVEMLRRRAAEGPFELEVMPNLSEDGVSIRSNRIRQRLIDGQVEAAARMLGRPYRIGGRVIHGDRRGHRLGFPTANLEVHPRRLVPANGVYAVRAGEGERRWGGMLNIGRRPTFDADGRTVEVHLFDYEGGELYDHLFDVQFIARIRDEQRFESPDALIRQLRQDEQSCRWILHEKRT
jgi:riboflavin kinase/FMN adenylyltransferase